MLTENIYNYRMEYPGIYVPNPPSTGFYPITPPYTHPYDSPPAVSAFTAVRKSEHNLPTTVPFTSNNSDCMPPLYTQHQPHYFPFYQPITPPHHDVYPTPPPLISSSSTTPSPPLIRQLLMKPPTVNKITSTKAHDDDDDVIFVDDDEHFDESAIRTSVIRKTTKINYEDAVSKKMHTISDATKSSDSTVDEEIICKWKSCFR